MPQTKIVKYDTKYKGMTINNGQYNLDIDLQPESVTPNTLEAVMNFSLIDVFINNKDITPGNLSIIMKNKLNDMDFHIDKNGHLVVNSEDCENYTLDNQGHLIYTYR